MIKVDLSFSKVTTIDGCGIYCIRQGKEKTMCCLFDKGLIDLETGLLYHGTLYDNPEFYRVDIKFDQETGIRDFQSDNLDEEKIEPGDIFIDEYGIIGVKLGTKVYGIEECIQFFMLDFSEKMTKQFSRWSYAHLNPATKKVKIFSLHD